MCITRDLQKGGTAACEEQLWGYLAPTCDVCREGRKNRQEGIEQDVRMSEGY